MDHVIEWAGDHPHDLTITTSGPADVDGFVRIIDEVLADPRYRPGMTILTDHTALDLTPLAATDMQAIAQRFMALDEAIGASRLAIVTPSPVGFGLVRVFEAYVDAARIDVSVFYSRAEAEGWLGEV